MIEGHRLAVAFSLHQIRAPDEAGDEARARARVDRVGRVDLLDPAAVHHGDAVGRDHRLALVVRDVDGGEAELVVQAADFEAHFLAQAGIEVRQRLVQQQHARLDHHGAGQSHALLLPAREFRRIAVGQRAKPHRLQDAGDARLHRRAVDMAQLQAEGDVLRHRHVRPDRIALEDHRHLPPLRRQRHRGGGDHRAVHADHAAAGPRETGDHAQRRRLAAAGWAEQRDEFPGCDVKIEPLHRRETAEDAADLFQRQRRRFGHDRRSMKSRPTSR
jgi:hypothetical protein